MAFDPLGGGDPGTPWCRACKKPIMSGQPSARVHFDSDPNGVRGLSGMYHKPCSRPFQSMAHVMKLMSRGYF
jgi:hypothetical protein